MRIKGIGKTLLEEGILKYNAGITVLAYLLPTAEQADLGGLIVVEEDCY